jgi:hypothetical protein
MVQVLITNQLSAVQKMNLQIWLSLISLQPMIIYQRYHLIHVVPIHQVVDPALYKLLGKYEIIFTFEKL